MLAKTLVPDLSIVIPCFNEGLCLGEFYNVLSSVCTAHPEYSCEFIFVDDGSKDNTAEIISHFAEKDPRVVLLEFSRNFGKEAALTAGLRASRGRMVVPIDADLQHPPQVIFELVDRYEQGDVDVVIAKRKSRDTDARWYQVAVKLFYDIQSKLTDCEIPRDAGDFRLISNEVVQVLNALPENRRYMKGLFAWVGFKTTTIDYEIAERVAGGTKFSPLKLLSLAANGILDFSSAPLRFWIFCGFFLSSISFIYGMWIVFKTLMFGVDVPGYASLITLVLFLGGIQLVSVGVIGEYVGRIYSEIKHRPTYIVRSKNQINCSVRQVD